MSLQTVHHSTFGQGTVIAQDAKYLTVDFGAGLGEKTFVFPDAFEKFLTYDNEEEQNQISEMIRIKKERIEKENAIKEEAAKKAAQKAEEERVKLYGKPKSVKKITPLKPKKSIEEIVEEVVDR